VRVCESQVAVRYNKTMLHTSAQHSAQLNNQYSIYTYCIVIYAIFTPFMLGFWYRTKKLMEIKHIFFISRFVKQTIKK